MKFGMVISPLFAFWNAYFKWKFKRLCGLNNIEDQLKMTVFRGLVDESVTKHQSLILNWAAVIESTAA